MSKKYITSLTIFLALGAASAAFASPVSSLMCTNPGSTIANPNQNFVNANSCTDFSYAFPGSQPATGLNNWQYGYYVGTSSATPTLNPSTFALMVPTPVYDANGNVMPGQSAGWWSQDFSRYWTALDAYEGHSNASYTDLHQAPYCNQALYANCGVGPAPGSPNSVDSGEYWATRRYIIPSGYAGLVNINLSVEKDPRTVSASAQGVTDYIVKVHGGVATVLACVNVPVNGAPKSNVAYPSCATPTTTADPLLSNQPIMTIAAATNVAAGDFIDVIQVPNYVNSITPITGGNNVAQVTTGGNADFSSGVFQLEALTAIPEPGTFGLLGAGLVAAGFARRRLAKRF